MPQALWQAARPSASWPDKLHVSVVAVQPDLATVQPSGTTRRLPFGVHTTIPPLLVTNAACSPFGAQASAVVGSAGPPAIGPPEETSCPSPLHATGPAPASLRTTGCWWVARSRTTSFPSWMKATRCAAVAAALAV